MSKMSGIQVDISDIDNDWDPMREEYENPDINRYEHGPGANVDVVCPAYRSKETNKPVYKLFVSNIPHRLNQIGIENLFLMFGKPKTSKIFRPASGKGLFSFVEYDTLIEARNAIEGIDRRPPLNIHVTFARSDAEHKKLKEQELLVQEERRNAHSVQSQDFTTSDVESSSVSSSNVYLRNLGRGRGCSRGNLLIKACLESRSLNSRSCVWFDGETDLRYPGHLIYDPNSCRYETSNRVQQSIVVSTAHGTRKVAMGRSYIPPHISSEYSSQEQTITMSKGTFQQGEDIHVPKRPCTSCSKETVQKCCQCGEAYCSKQCQKLDFTNHQPKCSPTMSIDITVDSRSMERSIKLAPLSNPLNVPEQISTPMIEEKCTWGRPEKHALDFVKQGQEAGLQVTSIEYQTCIGVLSYQSILEDTEKLVFHLPNCLQQLEPDSSYRPPEGTLVGVRLQGVSVSPDLNGTFWRGYVLPTSSRGPAQESRVALCDLGLIVTVPSENIVRLPQIYHNMPELTVKCSLADSDLPGGVRDFWDLIRVGEIYQLQIQDTGFSVLANVLMNGGVVGKILLETWDPVIAQRALSVVPIVPPYRVIMTAYHNQHAIFVRPIGKQHQEDFFKILQKVATVHVTSAPMARPPRRGEMVACLFKKDGNFYRAIVTDSNSENSNEYKVCFIDFGNFESVSADSMKALPDDLKMLPCMAVKVSLKNVPARPLTDDAIQYLDILLQKTQELRLACESTLEDGVELFLPGDLSVNVELNKLLLPEWRHFVNEGRDPHGGEVFMIENIPVLPLLPKGIETGKAQVFVSHILPDGRLSVCPVDRPEVEHVVKTLTDQINEYCEATDPLSAYHPRSQEVCLVRYKDGFWYRAANMAAKSSHSCEVIFLDYGNLDIVDFKNIRRMVPDFIRAPSLISMCLIDGLPEEPNVDLTKRVCDLVEINKVYDIQVLRMYEEGEYKIYLPQISEQLRSETVLL